MSGFFGPFSFLIVSVAASKSPGSRTFRSSSGVVLLELAARLLRRQLVRDAAGVGQDVALVHRQEVVELPRPVEKRASGEAGP